MNDNFVKTFPAFSLGPSKSSDSEEFIERKGYRNPRIIALLEEIRDLLKESKQGGTLENTILRYGAQMELKLRGKFILPTNPNNTLPHTHCPISVFRTANGSIDVYMTSNGRDPCVIREAGSGEEKKLTLSKLVTILQQARRTISADTLRSNKTMEPSLTSSGRSTRS